ncbi:MAG: oligosaccharyl transferase, archaeosortase A system-associated [Methanomicrobiales archaeon]|nr:oligosaccharyl transferase, archaeosortase A system-associated [Methanomicrobiales archaeon]
MFSLNRKNSFILILFCVILSAAIGFFFRLQTLLDFSSLAAPIVMHEDPWYTIRQIEQVVHNYPAYAWFDPMVNYPYGQNVQWGPFLPFICATLCTLFGVTTQGEIIRLVSWIPPVLFLVMIPICYLIGKKVWNQRVGILSAVFVSVVCGEFLYRSMYGNLDHHILEVILSFACILVYLFIIRSVTAGTRESIPKEMVFLSILTGFLFFLGYMNIPTIMVVALTISLFFLFFTILEKDLGNIFRLLEAQIIIFTTFSILYGISGIPYEGFSIQMYSYGAIAVAFAIMVASALLYSLKGYVVYKDKSSRYILTGLIIIIGICLVAAFQSVSTIITSFSNAFDNFFLISYDTTGIDELSPISLLRAVLSYNIAIALSIIGFIIVCHALYRNKNRLLLFFFIWATLISIISIMQVRYQYYEGPIVCILSAICLDMVYLKTTEFLEKRKIPSKKPSLTPKKIGLILVILISCAFYIISLSTAFYVLPTFYGKSIKSDWVDTTLWLKENTTSPGIDYYAIYDRETFSYPKEAYNTINWWGFGNYILTLGNRMPLGTPQQNRGARVSASFLLATNESIANNIITSYKGKYVVTNYDLSLIYPTVALWSHMKYPIESYIYTYYRKINDNLVPIKGLRDSFFLSMFTRMHYFDGSFQEATERNEISYVDIPYGNVNASMIITEEQLRLQKDLSHYLQKDEVSFNYTRSCVDVPALTSYRLVYESPQIVSNLSYAEIHNIKIFEHVKGYTIPGTGTVELPLVSNQGRHFTYRQQSINNTFTLPYSTTNSPYDVRATGPYRVIETNKTFDVDESQILKYYI